MSRRIDVELTSAREDGSWTWRAAGARQPKGVLDGSLLPAGAAVGQVVRAEVDSGIDGITVLHVSAPKGSTPEAERLEIISSRPDEPLVTTVLAPKGRGGGRRDRPGGGRRDRGPRPDGERRPRGERPESGRDRRGEGRGRGPRAGAERGGEGRPRTERPRTPASPPRPRAKRLRAGRAHRSEVLAALPPEQRPIAEQVLRAGIPGVRQSIDKQNEQARAEGRPEVKADALVALAEQLLPRLRAAEWHDRAEAALADIDDLDLRDLRTVVVAADANARDETTRGLADQLRAKLGERVEQAQQEWLTDLRSALAEGRVVRALKISSRPPKAGVPVPADVLSALTEAATAALTPDAGQDRWSMVVEALAFSPVHASVVPAEVPAAPGEELLAVVRRSASRSPALAARFGIEAPAPGGPRKGRRPVPPRPPRPSPEPQAKAAAAPAEPGAEAQPDPVVETPPEPAAPVVEASPEPAAPVAEVSDPAV